MSVLVEGLTTEHETKAGAHQISGISGLQGALDGKYSPSNKPTASDVMADPAGTASSAVSAHSAKVDTHPISSVTGLQAALDGKASSSAAANNPRRLTSSSDMNSIKSPGEYSCIDVVNAPFGGIGLLSVRAYSVDWVQQIYTYMAPGSQRVVIRYFHSGTTWSAWV